MVKIRTLMENLSSEHKSLIAEHGLSFYIETEKVKILFDFGAGANTWENASKLNIPLDEISYFVFSHSHYDHAAGFIPLGEQGYQKIVIHGPEFFQEKYAVGENKYTYLGCGFTEAYLKQHSREEIVCEGTCQIDDNIHIIGRFDRTHDFEQVPARFVKDTGDGMVHDQFDDEICLAIDTPEGLVVIVGCSHPGIMNMLSTVKNRLNRPIRAVIGGTHLVEASEERVKKSIEEMKSMGIVLLGINHCSGAAAEQIIREDAKISSCHLGVGDCLIF